MRAGRRVIVSFGWVTGEPLRLATTLRCHHTPSMNSAIASDSGESHPATSAEARPASSETGDETTGLADQPPDDPAESASFRNFVTLVAFQVIMRTGWIFKTESIIMPAVMDSLGGAAWLRGCLPVLNRFGQSVPPLLMSRRLKVMPRKRWALTCCATLMAASFLTFAGLWLFVETSASWMAIAFLICYAFFFMSTGVNQLAFNTLQGKLIPATRRGRLMLTANVFGGASAIVAAWLLLPIWLKPDSANFGMIFLVSGVCFAVAAAVSLLLAESRDDFQQPSRGVVHIFSTALQTLRDDPNLFRLGVAGALFGTSMMLFPHYQNLGRVRLNLGMDSMITWVIVQNAGTALFSFLAGPLADSRGNRLVLRCLLLGITSAPLLALVLAAEDGSASGAEWFNLVFLLVGLTPVVIKTFYNYTLETCEAADHPKYLSTMTVCVSAPIFLSPLFGFLVDSQGFEPVFLTVSGLVSIGWLITFTLKEPRHERSTSGKLN